MWSPKYTVNHSLGKLISRSVGCVIVLSVELEIIFVGNSTFNHYCRRKIQTQTLTTENIFLLVCL